MPSLPFRAINKEVLYCFILLASIYSNHFSLLDWGNQRLQVFFNKVVVLAYTTRQTRIDSKSQQSLFLFVCEKRSTTKIRRGQLRGRRDGQKVWGIIGFAMLRDIELPRCGPYKQATSPEKSERKERKENVFSSWFQRQLLPSYAARNSFVIVALADRGLGLRM